MNTPLNLSTRVLTTIQRLPESDRSAVASAVVSQLVYGSASKASLTPLQTLAFEIISFYVRHDIAKSARRIN